MIPSTRAAAGALAAACLVAAAGEGAAQQLLDRSSMLRFILSKNAQQCDVRACAWTLLPRNTPVTLVRSTESVDLTVRVCLHQEDGSVDVHILLANQAPSEDTRVARLTRAACEDFDASLGTLTLVNTSDAPQQIVYHLYPGGGDARR